MNHGQKLGLGAKPGVRQPPRGATAALCPGKLPVLFPGKFTLDTSGPNLIVPSLHCFWV